MAYIIEKPTVLCHYKMRFVPEVYQRFLLCFGVIHMVIQLTGLYIPFGVYKKLRVEMLLSRLYYKSLVLGTLEKGVLLYF